MTTTGNYLSQPVLEFCVDNSAILLSVEFLNHSTMGIPMRDLDEFEVEFVSGASTPGKPTGVKMCVVDCKTTCDDKGKCTEVCVYECSQTVEEPPSPTTTPPTPVPSPKDGGLSYGSLSYQSLDMRSGLGG